MLIRCGSISPRTEIAGRSPSGIHDVGIDFNRRSWSMRMSLDVKEKRDLPLPTGAPNPIRRVRSDTDLLRSTPFKSRWSPPMSFSEEKANLVMSMSPAIAEEAEDLLYSGGGIGNGRKMGGGSGGKRGGEANREEDSRIGTYYQEMLKTDPGNPLLLRNYGRFLHEVIKNLKEYSTSITLLCYLRLLLTFSEFQVEGDLERAEEYYGRAILASPNDGELLSLYGRLVWESQRDSKRAESYHERAAEASPENWYFPSCFFFFFFFLAAFIFSLALSLKIRNLILQNHGDVDCLQLCDGFLCSLPLGRRGGRRRRRRGCESCFIVRIRGGLLI
ncbi:hypothetical protein MA16_Dca020290 [Dendrobium catenatum]|uniref:Uncharacterized protein n=1 Tax=Dendrobium catenatum TaxID=906689 RepID=A0A2I0X489_9ASPA|nr:hypothetical protein MA16_Dca020290 [Dendrobium catenatum]